MVNITVGVGITPISIGIDNALMNDTCIFSQYHESCIPAHQRAPPHLEPNTKPIAVLDYTTCDAVKENKIWRQCVNNEANGVKKWEEKWSFLLEYDEKVGVPQTRPNSACLFIIVIHS